MKDVTASEDADYRMADRRYRDLTPLVLVVLILSLGGHVLAGELAIPFVTLEKVHYTLIMILVYGLASFIAVLMHSAVEASGHVDPVTRKVLFKPLWQSVARNPLPGLMVVLLTSYGSTSASNLTEIYRAGTSVWHDSTLWQLEMPVFAALHGSWLEWPSFWDQIYFQMWSFVLMVAVYIYRRKGLRRCAVLGASIVIAFYLTRAINIVFPTAGPAFFQPGWFSLDGTISQATQDVLLAYTNGRIPANGVYPATMAMPSLHVGLTAMAVGFLARERSWTLWFGLPWLLLVWMSTVMLGWHYLLDGVVGIGIGGLAVVLANRIHDAWDAWVQRKWIASPQEELQTLSDYRRIPGWAIFRKYGESED